MSDIPLGEVVIVDDDEDLLDTLEDFLASKNYAVRKATDAEGCLKLFQVSAPDMAMIDLGLEDDEKDGIWLLQKLHETEPDVPVVVLSGYARLDVGVRAMRVGAFDFIEKPIMPQYLIEIIKRTILVGRLRRTNRRLSAVIRGQPVGITGSSAAARILAEQLAQQADKNCRVMLFGPPGVGKEHAARLIHQLSLRSLQPFVTVNCRSDSREDIEKQIFGETFEDGDYLPGQLEQVNGGTIYFDEIAALPLDIQKLLVNALVRGRFLRVGGGAVAGIDCRVVSGTSEDIKSRIADGAVRKDLYDRLNVASVDVPPLDTRREDIPELCRHFTDELHRSGSLKRRVFSDDALDMLMSMHWPGNLRQLRNLVERMLLVQDADHPVQADEISEGSAEPLLSSGGVFWKMTLRDARNEFERQYLINQINRHGGNISIAAKSIGMERSALHRKLKGLNVETKTQSGGRIAGLRSTQN